MDKKSYIRISPDIDALYIDIVAVLLHLVTRFVMSVLRWVLVSVS